MFAIGYCSFLSGALLDLLRFIIGLLPDLEVPRFTFIGTVQEYMNIAYYFLPVDTIFKLFLGGLAITLFRLFLAVVYKLSDFIGDFH